MAISIPFIVLGAALLPVHELHRNETVSLTLRMVPRLARHDAGISIAGTF